MFAITESSLVYLAWSTIILKDYAGLKIAAMIGCDELN